MLGNMIEGSLQSASWCLVWLCIASQCQLLYSFILSTFIHTKNFKANGSQFLFFLFFFSFSLFFFLFFFCGFSLQWPCLEPSDPPAPSLRPAVPTTMLVPTVSTAKCDALIFLFLFLYCFCVFVLNFFPFLLRLCPEKASFACFLLFLHTFVYITFTSLFSIVCAKTDWFKRVSKKLF